MKKINRVLSAFLILMMCFSLFSDLIPVFAEELASAEEVTENTDLAVLQDDLHLEEHESSTDEVEDSEDEVITEEIPWGEEIQEEVPADDASLSEGESVYVQGAAFHDNTPVEEAETQESGSTTRPLSGVEITLIKDVRFLDGDSVSAGKMPDYVSIVGYYDNGSTIHMPFENSVDEVAEDLTRFSQGSPSGLYNIYPDPDDTDLWGVGVHNWTLDFCGKLYEFDVTVIESPVDHIDIDTVFVTVDQIIGPENDCGELHTSCSYPHYHVQPSSVTVFTKDGGSYSGTLSEVDHQLVKQYGIKQINYRFAFSTDQSSENAWGLGSHEANLSFWRTDTPFEVFVRLPIASVAVEPLRYIIECAGWRSGEIEKEDGTSEWVDYPYYDPNPQSISVTLNDGSVFNGSVWEVIYELGSHFGMEGISDSYSIASDQSISSQWGIGTHTATMTFLDEEYTVTVEIIENPILSVTSDETLIFREGFGDKVTESVEDEYGEWHFVDYIRYDCMNAQISAVTDEGTFSGTVWDVVQQIREYYSLNGNIDNGGVGLEGAPSADHPWMVGEHPFTVLLFNKPCLVNAEVKGSPVVSVEADEIVWIEGMAFVSYDWVRPYPDSPEVQVPYLEYGTVPRVTVVADNGKTYNGSLTQVAEEVCSDYEIPYVDGMAYARTDQSALNPWEPGEHTADILLFGQEYPFMVRILPDPIISITVVEPSVMEGNTSVAHVENTDSYGNVTEYDYEYYRYDTDLQIVMETEAGTFSGSANDAANWLKTQYGVDPPLPFDCDFFCEDDQTEDNVWGVGDHSVSFRFLNKERGTFDVHVVPNPVASISADPVSFVEGAGELMEYWDGDNVLHSYISYPIGEALTVHVVLNDDAGTQYDGNLWDVVEAISDGCGILIPYESVRIDTDAEPYTSLEVGSHTGTLTFLGKTCTFPIEITGSVIDWFTCEPVRLIEGDTVTEYDYIPIGENISPVEYQAYRYGLGRVTIKLKDSETAFTGSVSEVMEWLSRDYGIQVSGSGFSCSDDQGWGNEWAKGDHTVSVTFLGVSGSLTVKIIANPIFNLTVEPYSVIEGNTLTGMMDGVPYQYYELQPEITAVTDAGTFTGSPNTVVGSICQAYGLYWITNCDVTSEQGPGAEWTAEGSPYTAMLYFAGMQVPFSVNVESSPVQSFSVDPITFLEGDGGVNWGPEWPKYDVYENSGNYMVHVTMKDGSEFSGKLDTVRMQLAMELGINEDQIRLALYEMEGDTQAYPNVWQVGQHHVKASLLGTDTMVTVNVIENPIREIRVEPLTVWEGDTYFQYECVLPDYRYEAFEGYRVHPLTITLEYGDETYTGSPDELIWRIWSEKGVTMNLRFFTDQSSTNHWEVGMHSAVMRFGGFEVEYPVEVKGNPISVLTAESFKVYESDCHVSYFMDENGIRQPYPYYPQMPAAMHLEMNDGTTFDGTFGALIYFLSTEYNFSGGAGEFSQSYENQWTVGNTYPVTMDFSGVQVNYSVTVIPDENMEVVPSAVYRTSDDLEVLMEVETPEGLHQVWGYDIEPEHLEVKYDGIRFCEGNIEEVSRAIYSAKNVVVTAFIENNQPFDQPWGDGQYPGTLFFAGKEWPYTIQIGEMEDELLDTEISVCMTETIRLNRTGLSGATWSSRNSKIASVDQEGNVTGVGVGSTVITVRSADGKYTETCSVNVTFLDVTNAKDYFYTPVYWAVGKGITSGYTGDLAGLFGTHDTCTRGQIVTFLYRAFGSPEVDVSSAPKFKDVKKSDYFYKAVCWAALNGVTSGYTDSKGKPTGKFGPNDPCTRGQVVTFLYRAAGSPSVNTSKAPKFSDVKKNDYFYKAVCWAALNKITSGYSGTSKFGPNDPCERCQVVTFLYRARILLNL